MKARSQAALQTRREELEAAIEREVTEIENATAQAAGAAHSRWSAIKRSVENQVSEMRADFDKWQVEVKEKNGELAAEDAEVDAVAAVSIAAYCLDAAEWAVVRAELTHGEAEQLAAKG